MLMAPVQKHALLAAVGALLLSGVVCHLLARDSSQLDGAADRVALVPRDFGEWRGQDEETDASSFAMAGARGYWMRMYVNQRTKEGILVILMCGRPGRMGVHTPEVCYGGAGFNLRDEPTPVALKNDRGDDGQLWSAVFTKNTGLTTRLRLYWGWRSRGPWEAAPAPRWQFRGEPYLYKLYVARDLGGQSSSTAEADSSAAFFREFIPVLNETLFPPEGN